MSLDAEDFESMRKRLAAAKPEHRALTRDCSALRVPSGEPLQLEADWEVTIVRESAGAFVVQVPVLGGEARIAAEDADAIGKPVGGAAADDGPTTSDADQPLDARIGSRLTRVFDPELPVNIVDLGLVYSTDTIEVSPGSHKVEIEITLTTPQCGMGNVIARDIEAVVTELSDVSEVTTRVVWDPPWTPKRISPEGRKKLGLD